MWDLRSVGLSRKGTVVGMRVARAQRRWVRWCRYIQKTQSRANIKNKWGCEIHKGQAKAHVDVMVAHRWAPNGLRAPWYPDWGNAE